MIMITCNKFDRTGCKNEYKNSTLKCNTFACNAINDYLMEELKPVTTYNWYHIFPNQILGFQ